jgi:hypothetical protein
MIIMAKLLQYLDLAEPIYTADSITTREALAEQKMLTLDWGKILSNHFDVIGSKFGTDIRIVNGSGAAMDEQINYISFLCSDLNVSSETVP